MTVLVTPEQFQRSFFQNFLGKTIGEHPIEARKYNEVIQSNVFALAVWRQLSKLNHDLKPLNLVVE